MADAPALRELVGDPAGFLATSWATGPAYVAASDDRRALRDVLTLDDVDRIVASSGLRAPSFRLVEQGRTLPQRDVTRSVRIGSRPVSDLVDVAAVHRAVADGATLVLQGLHRSFPPVAELCRDLERTLTHPSQANAYLTPPVAQGLNLHADPHDVFAVQTFGTKRWVVHPPDSDDPWDLTLTPGDVLYLPAGTRHAAQTIDTPSLHLTIGIRTVTWRQLVDRVVRDSLDGLDALVAPLPAGWADEPTLLREQLASVLDDAASALRSADDLDAPLEAQARSFWHSRTPDQTGLLRDLLDADHLDDHTPLRRRAGVDVHVRTADAGSERGDDTAASHLEVVLPDRLLRLPANCAAALRRILDGEVARPADLDELMDASSRRVLCRRLVREGVLTIAREGGVPR